MNLKWIFILAQISFTFTACNSKNPEGSEKTLQQQELTAPAATARIVLKSPKAQTIGLAKLIDEEEGVRILVESKKLSKNTVRFTLEDSCKEDKSGKKPLIQKKFIKEMKIQNAAFSEEFFLKGYSLSKEDPAGLGGKVLKLYRVGKGPPARQIACGSIEL